jgi:hypothetical protein
MAEPSATSTTRCTQTTGVGVVHVELWAKLAGGAVRFRVANVRPVQSYRTHADRSWTWRARERFVCASSNSPRGGQICYRELLTRTFRKGMGLGVESEAVANAGHVLESVQSKVSVWYLLLSLFLAWLLYKTYLQHTPPSAVRRTPMLRVRRRSL